MAPDELIQCTGKEVVDGQTFTNWDPYVNEPMTMTTALAASCDTYFYQLGLRFYGRKDSPLQKWARNMGFGASEAKRTVLDLVDRHRHAGTPPLPELLREAIAALT